MVLKLLYHKLGESSKKEPSVGSSQTPLAPHQPSLSWHLCTSLSRSLETLVGYQAVPLIPVRFVD